MSKDTSAVNEAATPKRDFNDIVVTLTFEDFGMMTFVFARMLSKELREEKQAFLDKTAEEQKTAQTPYRIKLLAGLLKQDPIGVPNYGSEASDVIAGDKETQFVHYFSKPENEDLLDWVYTIYQNKLYPKELFSTPSA